MATPDRKAQSGGSFAVTSFEPRPVASDPALPATARPPDLPGCESFHLPESALDAYDGHLEFWDAREGTTPEDDPLTRSMSRRAAAQGHVEGRRQGHAEGVAAVRVQAVTAVLHARRVDAPAAIVATDVARRADLALDALVAAAVTCTDLSEFRRRLREMAVTDPPPESP